MSDRPNFFGSTVRATSRFGGTGYTNYANEQFVWCPLCHKPDVRLQGNQTLDQHLEFGNYVICHASGKSLTRAAKMHFDEDFNLVEEDLVEEDEETQ